MASRTILTISSLLLTLLATPTTAEKMLSMKIGMTWPRELLPTGVPTGDAEVNYGIIIDKKVAIGISGNFLWNVQSKEERVDTGGAGLYKTINAQKSFMFPIMGFFQLDPVPDLIVHPVGRFQIGYNSMIYSYTEVRDDGSNAEPLSPYFYGLIMKAGVDAMYDIGENSALFLGMEYRWADTKTATSGLFNKRNMGGIGLSAGFRLIL